MQKKMKKLTNYKKLLFGLMAFAMVFTVGGALAINVQSVSAQTVVSEPTYVHAVTLRTGSSGTAVLNLQSALNYVNAGVPTLALDGKFGPMTLSAVKKFQMAKGLSVDGIVGSRTGGALSAATMVVVTSPLLPAGCTSTTGFSSTTGVRCDSLVGAGLPAGCTSTVGFSPLTGVRCDSGLPAGCTSTIGYSPTTGMKCDSTVTTPPPSTGGPMQGGAGDAIFSETSADVESQIIEGQSNIKVHAFRVEAKDSDIRLASLKVNFVNADAGSSSRFDRYAGEVSVWMGSTKVGSSSASDFTRSGTSNSKTISLNNAIVREGGANRTTFYIAVSALPNIDSADHDSDTWAVTVDNIRFVDAQGAFMTDGYSESSAFDFTDIAGSGDVKARVSSGTGNPITRNVEVSDTGTTSDVLMLEFQVKAEGSDLSFDQVDLDVTGTGATPTEIASQLTLKTGAGAILGDLITLGTNGTKTINLFDDFTITKGNTATFRVFAKINKIGVGNFGQGDSLKVDFQDFSDSLESKNGDIIADNTIAGSAIGETQTFISEGAIVEFVSDSYTQYDATNSVDGTISLAFRVTALGNSNVTIAEDQGAETAGAGNNLIDYTVDGAVGTDAFVTCANETVLGGIYTISAGSNKTCTLAVKFNTVTGFVRLHINDVDGTPVSSVSTRAF